MAMKCIITEIGSDSQECVTMETAESWFSNGRFVKVMKDMDSYFCGEIVPDEVPLGYVEWEDSPPMDEFPHIVFELGYL